MKPAVNADTPGLYVLLGEQNLSARLRQPEATTADITTSAHLLELKITFDRVLEAKSLTERKYKAGWNEYTVKREFDMLQQKYSISQESLLD